MENLPTKLELHTALHEKLALTLAKVSYKHDFLITGMQSKREGGNFIEYIYDGWSEREGTLSIQVTVVSQEGEVYSDVDYASELGTWTRLYI